MNEKTVEPMQKQTFESDRTEEVRLRFLPIIMASTKERIYYDLDAALPDEERYSIDCGTLGRLDSRRLYRPQEDGTYMRISDGVVVSLPVVAELRAIPDDELPDALYCAKWGIAGEYSGDQCALYFEEGTEIEL